MFNYIKKWFYDKFPTEYDRDCFFSAFYEIILLLLILLVMLFFKNTI